MTATMSKGTVEILELKDARKAARTLYKSFDNDDVARYVSRHLEHDPKQKELVDMQLYEAYVTQHIMKGLALAIKGDDHENKDSFETVALWATPESTSMDDYITLIRSGFAKLAWNTGAEGRRRVFGVLFKVLHDNYDAIMSCDKEDGENVYTLVYLGSSPDARGKGNVRKMFEYTFQNHIDKRNSLTYLESSAIANLPIYEKFGFKATADIWLGDKEDPVDKARMDIMIRGPKGEEWKYLRETRERQGYTVPSASYAK